MASLWDMKEAFPFVQIGLLPRRSMTAEGGLLLERASWETVVSKRIEQLTERWWLSMRKRHICSEPILFAAAFKEA